MKKILFAIMLASVAAVCLPAAEVIRLWEGDAPGAKGKRQCDIPTLTLYKAKSSTITPAVIICPGGAYSGRATAHEGTSYAKLLNKHGITALVLAYRVGSQRGGAYRYPIPQLDAGRAVKLVRANAAKWQIDPSRIGIMGSSAGGHLAAMTAVKNDEGDSKNQDKIERYSSRPDFAILCYAQTSMDKRYGECAGSRKMLLGNDESKIREVAAYALVNDDTPPCFIWHTYEDQTVPVRNALDFANALENHSVPYSLHIYHAGRHGLGTGGTTPHPWCDALIFWLKEINVIR